METKQEIKAKNYEKERAMLAWKKVDEWSKSKKGDDFQKDIRSLIRSAPSKIISNGLGPTIAFWYSKGFEGGKSKDNKAEFHIIMSISEYLNENNPENIVRKFPKMDPSEYKRLTRDIVAFLNWLKRYGEGKLKSK